MIRGEMGPPVRIILPPQILPIGPHMIRGVQTRPLCTRLVLRRPVRQMASKNQHVPSLKRYGHPRLCTLPGFRDVPAMQNLDVHLVRAGDDLQAPVFWRGSIDGDVGGDVLNTADVVVGWGIYVGLEAISKGQFVVDLILEKEHLLRGTVRYAYVYMLRWELTWPDNCSSIPIRFFPQTKLFHPS